MSEHTPGAALWYCSKCGPVPQRCPVDAQFCRAVLSPMYDAAPDMLEALEEVDGMLSLMDPTQTDPTCRLDDEQLAELREIAAAAIAKAKGETE